MTRDLLSCDLLRAACEAGAYEDYARAEELINLATAWGVASAVRRYADLLRAALRADADCTAARIVLLGAAADAAEPDYRDLAASAAVCARLLSTRASRRHAERKAVKCGTVS